MTYQARTTEFHLAFRIISETLSARELTRLVKLAPDGTWVKGALRGATAIKEVNHGIEFCLKVLDEADTTLNDEAKKLLKRLDSAIPAIQALPPACARHLACAVYSAKIPDLCFDAMLIKQLGTISASIDVDLYFIQTKKTEGSNP